MNNELRIKNKKRLVLIIFIVIVSLFFSNSFVFAQTDYGLGESANIGGLTTQYESDLSVFIGNMIGTVLSFVSVIFFGLMLYGGIRWMLSRGNDEEAKKALDTIIAAVIGIIIVLGSYAITSFVLNSFMNSSSSGSGGVVVEVNTSATST